MSINIYDDLNRLEATFRSIEEFGAVEKAVHEVQQDGEALELFKSFRNIQLMLQEKQMRGEDIPAEELEQAQEIAQQAQENSKIMKMLEAEMQLSNVLEEVNRVLMKPVQQLYETLQ